MILRFLAGISTLGLAAAAVVVVARLLSQVPGPTSAAPSAPPPAAAAVAAPAPAAVSPRAAPHGFPAPPENAVVFSRRDGARVLALGVVPGRPLVLQASVLDGQGKGLDGLSVSFAVRSAGRAASTAEARRCGAGCYRAQIALEGQPRSVFTSVRGKGRTTGWTVALPAAWPPPSGASIVQRADRAWRALKTVVFHDRLASDGTHVLSTNWQIVAPDRLAYQVAGGSSAVVVGRKRWDRNTPGARWSESDQIPRLRQPLPFWVAASDARVLGEKTFRGRPVWDISFFDPRTPAWFEILVDRRTYRTLDLRMNTTAHFMHDTYGPFNVPLRIEPPR
jgi:hypothetical protein